MKSFLALFLSTTICCAAGPALEAGEHGVTLESLRDGLFDVRSGMRKTGTKYKAIEYAKLGTVLPYLLGPFYKSYRIWVIRYLTAVAKEFHKNQITIDGLMGAESVKDSGKYISLLLFMLNHPEAAKPIFGKNLLTMDGIVVLPRQPYACYLATQLEQCPDSAVGHLNTLVQCSIIE